MERETRLETLLREFRRLRKIAEGALAQVDDAGFFAADGPEGNSVAILVKHMAGNMLSRWTDFLTSDGEKPDRDRDAEFVVVAGEDRAAIMARWERGWACLLAALAPLSEADFEKTVTIRGEAHSVDQAVHRQLSHYAYHVGQIVHAARRQAGADWRILSVARGDSARFNLAPARYLDASGDGESG